MPPAFKVCPPALVHAITLAPSLKVTVPLGVPVPAGPVTVAVKVRLSDTFAGLSEELRPVADAALPIVNDCGTSGAGLKFVSPACLAVIVHEPVLVRCTVFVLIVQLPPAVKLTGNVDEAFALTVKSASPNVLFVKAAKVMV